MNGLTPPKSGATEWPPGPTPRASRGAPEPSDSFAGILNSQARTATAEGQDRSPKEVKGPNKRRDDDGRVAADRREADRAKGDRPVQHHEDDAQTQPANSGETQTQTQEAPVAPAPAAAVIGADVQAQAQTQTQEVVAPQPQAPVAVADAPKVATEQPAVQPQVQPQQPQPAQQQVAAKPEAKQAAQAEQPQAVQVAEQPAQDAPVAVADETVPATPQPTDGKPADRPAAQAAPVAASKPKQQGASDNGNPQQQDKQQGSLPQPAADQARTVAQAYGRNTANHQNTEVPTTAQGGTPAATPATPVAGGQPAAAARGEFAPATPVPLARAAENVEHVLRLASQRGGVTHARIALTPESLGSIDVHLRHTADGVVAKVVAHAPEAVQQLQQAAADLRRQLDAQGVNVLSLDIGHSASEDRAAGGAGSAFADTRDGEAGGSSNAAGSAGAEEELIVNSTLQLPNGVLVDVLA